MKKDNKGFSLVELIIVIAIMAVLVGLLAPQYLKYVSNSKVSTDISNAQEIATALNVAFADDLSAASMADKGIMPDGTSFPKSKYNAAFSWSVHVGDNGVDAINLGGKAIYPDPKTSGGYYSAYHK